MVYVRYCGKWIVLAISSGLFLLFGCSNYDPVAVSIPFSVEIDLLEEEGLIFEPQFRFVLEAVEVEDDRVIPLPETAVIMVDSDESTILEFSEIEFTESGVFEYRVFQEIERERLPTTPVI